MLRQKYRGVVMASSSQPRPIQRCPSCGKPIPAYRFKSPYCDHCGWRAAPAAQTPQKGGSLGQKIAAQVNGIGSQGQRFKVPPLLQPLLNFNFYLYLLWGISPLFPLVVDRPLLAESNYLLLIPLLLSWGLLYLAVRDLPLPDDLRLPRLLLDVSFILLPFFQKINVSKAPNRPYWNALLIWVIGILLLAALRLWSFSLLLTAVTLLLTSFCTLLF
ncbi:hypothetical protein NW870_01190 [Synechococcus sp. R50.1]|jgi:ribosomal protein L37AE/L43A|uniref:hypothetical protein n=2 Tax=Synechococcus TaxID=1129 RepID=UPI0039C1A392